MELAVLVIGILGLFYPVVTKVKLDALENLEHYLKNGSPAISVSALRNKCRGQFGIQLVSDREIIAAIDKVSIEPAVRLHHFSGFAFLRMRLVQCMELRRRSRRIYCPKMFYGL
jgi:hypothetical protein